jgi:hypothetical protein
MDVIKDGKPLFVFDQTGGAADLVCSILRHHMHRTRSSARTGTGLWEPTPEEALSLATCWADTLAPTSGRWQPNWHKKEADPTKTSTQVRLPLSYCIATHLITSYCNDHLRRSMAAVLRRGSGR